MDNTCIWIVVVIGAVVLTIVCYKRKNAQQRRSQNPNIYMWIPESPRVTTYIDPNRDYTDDEAIELAHKMKGVTLLRTNKGRIYINSLTRHAEIVFIENTPNPEDITGLWITNSPCYNCAQHLINHLNLTNPVIQSQVYL